MLMHLTSWHRCLLHLLHVISGRCCLVVGNESTIGAVSARRGKRTDRLMSVVAGLICLAIDCCILLHSLLLLWLVILVNNSGGIRLLLLLLLGVSIIGACGCGRIVRRWRVRREQSVGGGRRSRSSRDEVVTCRMRLMLMLLMMVMVVIGRRSSWHEMMRMMIMVSKRNS